MTPYTCKSVIHWPKKEKHQINLKMNTTDSIFFPPKKIIFVDVAVIFFYVNSFGHYSGIENV